MESKSKYNPKNTAAHECVSGRVCDGTDYLETRIFFKMDAAGAWLSWYEETVTSSMVPAHRAQAW